MPEYTDQHTNSLVTGSGILNTLYLALLVGYSKFLIHVALELVRLSPVMPEP